MKVCQILAGNEDGGLEKHTIELSKQLKSKGLDVTVIAHKDFQPLFGEISFIPFNLTKSRYNPFMLYALFQILKEGHFDIIHAQASKATAILAPLKPFLPTKCIATLHSFKNNLRSFQKMDFVITVSEKIGERLSTHIKKTIYNGIANTQSPQNIDLYARYNISKEHFIICSVARLSKVKRFDLLFKALCALDSVHLILVGDGLERDTLHYLAKTLKIQDRITFTGALDNQEAKNIIAASNLFVMSSDKEGFPYTFIESMFCKTPFISTPVSDLPRFIHPNYVVPFNDEKALTDVLKYAQSHYNETIESFQNLFEKAQMQFTVEHMTQETIDVYKKVLA